MKYSKDELKSKAQYTLAAVGTAKYKQLIFALAIKQGMLPAAVEQKLRIIANC